ncbi:MAG: FG-GAP-like repeat-containing protein [Fibrobacterota bacterium]
MIKAALAAFFIFSFYAEAKWTTPLTADFNTNMAKTPQIAGDTTTGEAMAVFIQSDGTNDLVYASKYDLLTGWQAPVAISGTGQNALSPRLISLGAGEYLLIYLRYDGSLNRLRESAYNGTSWSAPTTLDMSNGFAAASPDLAVRNSGGHAFAVWQQNDGTQNAVYAKRYIGSWETAYKISDATNGTYASEPKVAFDASGAAFSVFIQNDGSVSKQRIAANRWNGSSWVGAEFLSSTATHASDPAVAMDGTGKAVALYEENSNLYSHFYNSGWGGIISVDTGAGSNILAPEIKHLGGGAYMAVYSQNDGGQSIFAIKYSGSAWETRAEIDANTGSAYTPKLTVNKSGKVTAVFRENSRIYTNQYDGAAWSGPLLIDANTNAATSPAVAYTLDDNALCVFAQSDGTNDRIFQTISYSFKRWDYGASVSAWSNAANWHPNETPKSGDSVVFDGTGAGACLLDQNATVGSMLFNSGHTYGFDFGSYILSIEKNADFQTGGTITPSTGGIDFIGTVSQSLIPPSGNTLPAVTQSGSGGTVVATNPLTAASLSISAGDFDISANSITLNTSGDLALTGGSLSASAGNIDVNGNVSVGAGASLSAPGAAKTFKVAGGFSNAGTFTHNGGDIEFDGTTGSFNIDMGGAAVNTMHIWGSGGTWTLTSSLASAADLELSEGTLKLGTANTHIIDSFTTSMGTGLLDFGSSVLNLTSDAYFGQVAIITPGTGSIEFANTSMATLTPHTSELPPISKTGSGTLTIAADTLRTSSFSMSSGTLDMGGYGINSSGDISVTNGTSTSFSGLDGSVLIVGGNGYFTGQSGNLLNMNPASAWYINTTGTLTASYANIGNCDASGGSMGVPDTNCTDAGGNLNWDFNDPPVLTGLSGAANINASQRTDGSGIVDIDYEVSDGEQSTVSVSVEYYDGSSWMTASSVSGDAGASVDATSSVTDRQITWNALTELGSGIDAGNYNIRINADDGYGLQSTAAITMASNSLVIDTKAPVEATQAAFTTSPVAGTSITLDAAFTETNPGSNTYYYELNTGGYDAGTAGDAGVQDPSSVNITVPEINGDDYFSGIRCVHTDAYGNSFTSENTAFAYVKPYTPAAPSLTNATTATVDATVNPNASAASGLEYAIYVTPSVGGFNWVQSDGTVGSTEYWQTAATWGTITVTGLSSPVSQYSFQTKSRNSVDMATESDLSSGASATLIYKVWDGGGADNYWSTAANWDGDAAPSSSDSVVFDATSTKNCILDASVSVKDIVFFTGYTGDFDFSSYTLTLIGDADFGSSGGTITANSGTLEFQAGIAQKLTPHSSSILPVIKQNGSGGTQAVTNELKAAGIQVLTGNLDLSGISANIDGDISISSGASLSAPSSTISVSGGFSNNGSFVHNGGSIEFDGTSGSHSINPGASVYNGITVWGSGGYWTLTGNLSGASSIMLADGTLDLGTGLTHNADALSSSSGGAVLGFGSSALSLAGNADFSFISDLIPGTGSIDFSGSSLQVLTPPASDTLPLVSYTGSDTLRSGGAFSAMGFSQSSGTVDFYSYNAESYGDFSVTNGTSSSFTGHEGVTINVSGNASFTGQDGNLLNMNPSSVWYINTAGSLTASYANIGNCDASGGSKGTPDANCSNAGGNINWDFDETPPDNDMTLTAKATALDKVSLSWNPSMIDSTDADSVGIWYSTIAFPTAAEGGTEAGRFDLTVTEHTVTVSSAKTLHYFILAVKDSTGNWSTITPLASDSSTLLKKVSSSSAGIDAPGTGINSYGAAAADYNNDGYEDIYLARNGTDILYKNNGDGTFTDVSSSAGVSSSGMNYEAAWGDYNNDGYIDVYTCDANFSAGSNTLYKNNGDGTFTDVTSSSGTGYTKATHCAVFFDMDNDEDLDLFVGNAGDNDVLYKNNGDGTFTDITASAVPQDEWLDNTLDAKAADFNDDGHLDLLITGDMGSNYIYTGSGDGTFTRNGSSGISSMTNVQDALLLDYNNDGNTDIYFATGSGSDLLYEGDGSGNFSDMSSMLGAGNSGTAVYAVSGDFDNNGYEDIFVINTTTNVFLMNDGGTFTQCASFAGVEDETSGSSQNGALPIDYDNDGDLDIYMMLYNPPNLLFENKISNGGKSVYVKAAGYGGRQNAHGTGINIYEAGTTNILGSRHTDGTKYTVRFGLSQSAPNIDIETVFPGNIKVDKNSDASFGNIVPSGQIITISKPDNTPPENITGLSVSHYSKDSLIFTWSPSASSDANHVKAGYRTDGTYPSNEADAVNWNVYSVTDNIDTIGGFTEKATYHFGFFVYDSAGNMSPASSGARDSVTVPDYTIPENVTGFSASNLNGDSAIISWTPSVSADAESLMVRVSEDGTYPSDLTSGNLWSTLPADACSDTVYGLGDKKTLYFGVFVKDSSGNWAEIGSSSQGNVDIPDLTPPDNAITLSATALDTSRIALAWQPGQITASDAESILILMSESSLPASHDGSGTVSFGPFAMDISSDTAEGLLPDKMYYFSAFVKDSSGNYASFDASSADSVKTDSRPVIKNNPPVFTSGDITDTISSSEIFLDTLESSDPDADAVTYSISGNYPDELIYGADDGTISLDPGKDLRGSTFDFLFTASDGDLYDTVNYSIYISKNRAPVFSKEAAFDTISSAEEFRDTVIASDMDFDDTLTYTVSGNKPSGMTIDEKEGAMHYQPSKTDRDITYDFLLIVSDGELSDTIEYGLYIKKNNPPEFISLTDIQLMEDILFRDTLKASDADGDNIVFGIEGTLSSKLTFSSSEGSLEWMPLQNDVGSYTVKFLASDGIDTAEKDIAIKVLNTNDRPVINYFYMPDSVDEDSIALCTLKVSDEDPNDSLLFEAEQFSLFGNPVKTYTEEDSSRVTAILKWKPDNADIGLHSLILTVSDSGGLSASKQCSIFVRNTDDPPEITLVKLDTLYGALRAEYSVTDPDYAVSRKDNGKRNDPADSTAGAIFIISKNGTPIDTASVSGKVYNKDSSSVKIVSEFRNLYDGQYSLLATAEDSRGGLSDPSTVSWSVKGLISRKAGGDSAWHMVSVPFKSVNKPEGLSDNDLFIYDPSAEKDPEYGRYKNGSGISKLARGKSYWLNTDKRITLTSNASFISDSLFQMQFKSGWNQTASPFPFALSVYKDTIHTYYVYRNGSYAKAADCLEPWKGYFVWVPSDTTVLFKAEPSYDSSSGLTARRLYKGGGVSEEKWQLNISVVSGENTDDLLTAGVVPGAGDGFDALNDRPKPPSFSSKALRTAFLRSSWHENTEEFSRDIRAPEKDEHWWEFRITGTKKKSEIKISGIQSLPAGKSAYLVKGTGTDGSVYDLEKTMGVFVSEEQSDEEYYSLVVTGDPDFSDRFKLEYGIRRNYPNPFNPSTTIEFTLPYEFTRAGRLKTGGQKVNLNVYDIRGRLVKTMAEKDFERGRTYRMIWSGYNNSGRSVASGIYLIRFSTGNYAKTRKMTLIR